ncbi:TPA: hypothetical protein HA265_06795, partial [Candidatus Woesearchaeota archaeon]|nr:hypothetical protein [Candidatus Woesearchaeota archaeon]
QQMYPQHDCTCGVAETKPKCCCQATITGKDTSRVTNAFIDKDLCVLDKTRAENIRKMGYSATMTCTNLDEASCTARNLAGMTDLTPFGSRTTLGGGSECCCKTQDKNGVVSTTTLPTAEACSKHALDIQAVSSACTDMSICTSGAGTAGATGASGAAPTGCCVKKVVGTNKYSDVGATQNVCMLTSAYEWWTAEQCEKAKNAGMFI